MLVFSCSGLELSHDIPKVCLSLVSGPYDVSFLHAALCCNKENVLREEEWKKLFSTRSTGVPLGRRIWLPPTLPHQRVTPGTTQGRAPLSRGLSWARFTTVYVRH